MALTSTRVRAKPNPVMFRMPMTKPAAATMRIRSTIEVPVSTKTSRSLVSVSRWPR